MFMAIYSILSMALRHSVVKVIALMMCVLMICQTAMAGNGLIYGPATAGLSGTFTYHVSDDATYTGWRFTVSGGSIQSSSKSGYIYTVVIKFNTPGTQQVKFLANGSVVYDKYDVTVSGCPGKPSTNNGSNCGRGTVTLTASASSGSVVRWYTSGGSYLSTGNYFTTPTLSSTTTYLAESYSSTYGCSSSRVSVTATIIALPPAPVSIFASPTTVCGSGTVTLSASPVVAGESFVWYDAAGTTTSSTPTANASSPTFSVARKNNSTGCVGSKISIGINIDTSPVPFTVGGGGTYCSSGAPPPVTLSGSQTGLQYILLDANNTQYGIVNGTGGALTWNNSLAANGIFTVKVFSEHNACSLPMTGSVTVTPDPVSVGGTVSPTVVHSYGYASGTITLTEQTGSILQWEKFNGAVWSVLTGTAGAPTYTYVNHTATASFRAQVKSGTCPAVYSSTSTINVYDVPSFSATQTIIPYGGSSTLTCNHTFTTYQWILNGVDMPGKTAKTLIVRSPGRYKLRVTGGSTAPPYTTGELVISRATDTRLNLESTTLIHQPGVKATTSLYSLTADKLMQTITYSDGMGRPQQVIAIGASPARRDMIQYFEYSAYGLSEKQYLPYASSALSDGQKRAAPVTEQNAFYHLGATLAVSDAPYAVSKLAASPLANLREQGAPGTAWQPGAHSVKMDMIMNIANQVRYWKPNGTTNSYYAANTLAVSQITDENGNMVRTFTDKLGNTVLKQVQLDETVETRSTPWLETYYVYDGFGNLIYQLPPKAMALLGTGASLTAANATVAELIYKYTYDAAGRLTQKKVPNAVAQYIVYDTYDRPVLMQDGNLRATNQWYFVKYDSRDRVVMTGRFLDATHNTLATMQAYVTTTAPTLATYEEEGTTLNGYTNLSFPITNYGGTALTLHAVNYYDHYDFNRDGSADYTYAVQGLTDEMPPAVFVEGKPTGHTKLIEGTTTWLTSVVFYDGYGHVIQQRSNNHLSAAMDNLSTVVYDLEGKAKYAKTYHNGGGTNQLTVLGRYGYDNAGRLLNVYQTLPGATEQLIARYAYNELGQLVDKKLHSTATNVFMQSIDYRYNERGWLTSINNAQVNTTDPDAAADYFGMELLYEKTETGLNDQAGDKSFWNGNISATKWHNPGLPAGAVDQRSYKYLYDKSDKLKTATFQANTGTAWTKEAGTLNEQMAYDVNGNILTLQRNTVLRSFASGAVTAAPQAIDNLTYTYKSSTNALQKVEDATANAAGFANGSNVTDEYVYSTDGSLKGDLNKGIGTTGIVYNALGKPKTITYTDGRKLEYTYDMDGNKLTLKTYAAGSSTPASTVDYVGGFVYENGALSYFGSPEGRAVKKGASYELQYAIADHQGNTRVLFSSAAPAAQVVTATFETATQATEVTNFNNYPSGGNRSGLELYDHTDVSGSTYTYSQLLNGGNNSIVGLAKSYKVYPGDKVKVEAYAKYYNPQSTASNIAAFATALTSALGVSAGSTGDALLAYNGLNSYGGYIAGGSGNGNTSYPKAFVTILLYDENFKFLDVAYDQIDGGEQVGVSPKAAHDYLSKEYTVKEAGYAYVYISNETQTLVDVYFDDVKMTYTPTNILQVNEYYPYGLQTAGSWTREGNSNNFLYNGGTEQNATTGLYDLTYRNFDPALGRYHQLDPMADDYSSLSPYNYAGNDPVYFNDPDGLEPQPQGGCSWCTFDPNIKDGSSSGQMFAPDMIDVGYGTLNLTTGNVIVNGAAKFGGPTLQAFHEAYSMIRRARDGDKEALDAYASMYGTTYELWETVYESTTDGGVKDSEVTRQYWKKTGTPCPRGQNCMFDSHGKIMGMSDKKDLQAEMLKDVAYLLRDTGKGLAKELIIYYAGGKVIQMIFRGGRWVYFGSKLATLSKGRGIFSVQKSLNSRIVKKYFNQMMNGEFKSTRGAAGFFSDGNYYLTEGNHRMTAALQYAFETGDVKYVNAIISQGRFTAANPLEYGFKIFLFGFH
jgi:RHS repeat-associated protein